MLLATREKSLMEGIKEKYGLRPFCVDFEVGKDVQKVEEGIGSNIN
jgi:hypothetical protein